MHIFPDDVKSSVVEDVHRFKDSLLKANDDDLYPLIYSAALADESTLKELLPSSKMELVQKMLTANFTSLLKIIIEAPLRKIQNCGTKDDSDIASLKCLKTFAALRQ